MITVTFIKPGEYEATVDAKGTIVADIVSHIDAASYKGKGYNPESAIKAAFSEIGRRVYEAKREDWEISKIGERPTAPKEG